MFRPGIRYLALFKSIQLRVVTGVNQFNSELNQNKMGLKLLLYDKN